MMEQSTAVAALSALAQNTRLSVFRLLVRAGPGGLIADAIAEAMAVPASTMSHHLATLERAQLVIARRESRLIHYSADYAGIEAMLAFLLGDCCQGMPDLCGNLLAAISCDEFSQGAKA